MATYDQIDDFLNKEYPQLANASFFDYHFTSPISESQISEIKNLGNQLIASPHSSEEQSDFDRVLVLLRKSITELFNTNLINYSVILFQTPEFAFDEIFESFPWSNGSHFVIDENFDICSKQSFHYAIKNGATESKKDVASKSHSILCLPYSDENVDVALQYQKKGFGVHHVLFDATPAAPFHFPDLTKNPFDFYLISLKKICGIELCAALIKLQAAEQLRPQFYGGGAVAFSCARDLTHRSFKSHTKRLENGTPPHISIFAAYSGLNLLMKFFSQNKEAITNKLDSYIQQITDFFNEKSNIHFEVNDYTKEITFSVDGKDAKELQLKFIEQKVIIGVIPDNKLRLSFGFGVRDKDISQFLESSKYILTL